jgi:phenylalanyl-tRNA synthetase beta chain
VSRYPSSDVDLAFVVDEEVAAQSVERSLWSAGGALVESVTLFDVYRGEGIPAGTRSLAYRLRFCAADHTMTDEDVASARRACIDAVERAHGAHLRS